MAEQLNRYTTEDLSEIEAKRLLRKFAKFRSLVILPFGFLHKAQIVRKEVVNCLLRITWKWQIDEQVRSYRSTPLSDYRNFSRDYTSKMKHVPDTFVHKTRTYIVPGTEREDVCDRCRGQRLIECNNCKGTGSKDCLVCDGTGYETERPLCQVCDGEGRISCPSTITIRGPGNSIYYRAEEEREDICPNCYGTGYGRERIVQCYFCDGKGERECTPCGGSGKVKCQACEGKGKTYAARVAKVTFMPSGSSKTEISSPSYIPVNYINKTLGKIVSQEIVQISANVVERREIRKIPVKTVQYRLGDKTYSLYQIDGELKFNKYPMSIKRVLAFLACVAILALLLAIVLHIALPGLKTF